MPPADPVVLGRPYVMRLPPPLQQHHLDRDIIGQQPTSGIHAQGRELGTPGSRPERRSAARVDRPTV